MSETPEGIKLQYAPIDVRKSSLRETPTMSFGEQFKTGLATTARVVRSAAASAGLYIPGASIVSAAITGAGAVRDAQGSAGSTGTAALTASGSGASVGTSSYGGYMDDVAGRAAGGDASSQMMMATQQMQEM